MAKTTEAAPAKGGGWANRITSYANVAPSSLLANPRNYRVHPTAQQEAMTGALDGVGWIAPVIVNETTGLIVDGHLRVSLAVERNDPTVPVAYVRLSVAEEATALATFDPVTALATVDAAKLDALLRDVDTGSVALQAMLADLARGQGMYSGGGATASETPPDAPQAAPGADAVPDGPWIPPAPTDSRYKTQYGVIVMCASEDHQQEVYENLQGQGYECKVVVT